MILIVYYFGDICTCIGDEPPQQDDEIDEVVEQPITHRPVMPEKSDLRFQTELTDRICHIFTTEGV